MLYQKKDNLNIFYLTTNKGSLSMLHHPLLVAIKAISKWQWMLLLATYWPLCLALLD